MKREQILGGLVFVLVMITGIQAQDIFLQQGGEPIAIARDGERRSDFYQAQHELDCGMPQLYILGDSTHENYTVTTYGVLISSVQA
jgi:hypothetical protein